MNPSVAPLVGLSLAAATVVMPAVLAFVRAQNPEAESAGVALAWVLTFLGATLLGASSMVARMLRKKIAPRLAELSAERAFVLLFTPWLIGAALREAAALIGGVMHFLTGETIMPVTLVVLSVLLQLRDLPSAARLESWRREQMSATTGRKP